LGISDDSSGGTSESALGLSILEHSTHLVVFEVNWNKDLSLDIGWSFNYINVLILRFLVIEKLNLILSVFISNNGSINEEWII
jgi:hypothetical protein